jgi:outer membrane immunogenic protein
MTGGVRATVRSLAAFVCLGLAQLGAATPASAADLGPRPLLAPDSTWTGFYAGINAGGLWASGDAQWNPLPSPAAFGANPTSGSVSASSVVAGFQGGYDFQFAPAFVAGIEADLTGVHATASTLSTWTTFGTGAPVAGSFTKEIRNLEWLTTARGRIGYLVTPSILAYFTGGGAWGGVSYAGGNTGPGGYATAVSFHQAQPGYVLGGGVELMSRDRWLVRGEYLFYGFSDASAVGASSKFPNIPSGYSWTGFDVHEVRAAVSYKF